MCGQRPMNLSIAEDVIYEMHMDDGDFEIDPVTLALLAKVISMVVVYIIQNCVLNKKVANNPGFLNRFRLNRLIQRIGREEGLEKGKRDKVYGALLKKGAKTTEEDINQVLAEAGRIN